MSLGEKITAQTMPILVVDDGPLMGGYGKGECTLCAINAGTDFFPIKSPELERLTELPWGLKRR